ncbi:CHAD domain-containing protein [Desulfogranum japonicum]|uniref:CHAD domain-containing protein n=1 Tax=Desulfogranum japonicum TaxID=231447 RepID=UPI00042808BF|nr:CHAD domain-containing protein [Desulfogranum japonicum]
MLEKVTEVWNLTEEYSLEALVEKIEGTFSLQQDEEYKKHVTWYDTYDWRLYEQGYVCLATGSSWSLYSRDSGVLVKQVKGVPQKKAVFASAFVGTDLTTIFTKLLEVRALLPLQTAQYTLVTHRVLNKDEKTVVRFIVEQYAFEGTEEVRQLAYLMPVRGYRDEYQAVRQALAPFPSQSSCPLLIGLEAAAATTGRHPGDYSSKFNLSLDPDQVARSAVTSIYTQLAETMRVNVPGVIADLDSEFLHDLRVAIRRTRSGLTLIKKVLPEEVVARFKAEFKKLGSVTGPVRDLDVYLLSEEKYRKRLPACLQPGLTTFFTTLQQERQRQQKLLARELKSGRVESLLVTWEKHLQQEDKEPAQYADNPIVDVARKVIYRRYKRVMKDGQVITPGCPDEKLHELRIEGKKLRYAMEFFRSLFPKEEIETAIKQLKTLQNNLGDFNDLSVQREMLLHTLEKLKPGSRKNQEMAAALGGLMASLAHEQQMVRTGFEEIFRAFSHPDNVGLYNRLFKG